jgi:Nickel/cobalt transporter regulator
MKSKIIGLLVAATFMTPAAQAAEAPVLTNHVSAQAESDADFRRGGRDGGHRGDWGRGQNRGQNQGQHQQQPQQGPQQSQAPQGGGRERGGWSQAPQQEAPNRGYQQQERRGRGWSQTPQQQQPAPQQQPEWRGRNEQRNDDRGTARGYRSDRESSVERGYRSDRQSSADQRWNGGHNENRRYEDQRRDNRQSSNRDNRSHDRSGSYGRNDSRRWDNGWRNDRRYDYRSHRQRYGDNYRIGRYHAPDRYSRYRRFNIGLYLGHSYYNDHYWINDPWQYRLPDVWGSYRWVRYYDDVILIDVRNGYVVDVIYDFFW